MYINALVTDNNGVKTFKKFEISEKLCAGCLQEYAKNPSRINKSNNCAEDFFIFIMENREKIKSCVLKSSDVYILKDEPNLLVLNKKPFSKKELELFQEFEEKIKIQEEQEKYQKTYSDALQHNLIIQTYNSRNNIKDTQIRNQSNILTVPIHYTRDTMKNFISYLQIKPMCMHKSKNKYGNRNYMKMNTIFYSYSF